jgi:hypothetical protein
VCGPPAECLYESVQMGATGWRAAAGSAQPDLMMHYGSVPFDMNTVRHGYPTADNGFCLTPNVTQGGSRGTVRLRSLDFRDRAKGRNWPPTWS